MPAQGEDPRKTHVVNLIAEAVAPPDRKAAALDALNRDEGNAISAFLDGSSTSILKAGVSGLDSGRMSIQLSNQPGAEGSNEYQLVMTKLRSGPIRMEDIPQSLMITSISASPATSFYHAIQSTYGPAIRCEGDGQVDPRISEIVVQLEAGLGAHIRQGQPQVHSSQNGLHMLEDEKATQHILRPLDELKFWTELLNASGPSQSAIHQIQRTLGTLEEPLVGLRDQACKGWEEVKELVDIVVQCLRETWKIGSPGRGWPYKQKRMMHFFTVLGAEWVGYIQDQLKEFDIWGSSFRELKPHLVSAGNVLSLWESEIMSLTKDWTMGVDNNGHAWEGEPFVDSYVVQFQERIDEIFHIREAHHELTQLLDDQELSSAGFRGVFQAFRFVNALQVSDYTQAPWEAAREQYEMKIAPMEERVGRKLKEMLRSELIPSLSSAVSSHGNRSAPVGAQPHQIFSELRKFGGLLSRPTISKGIQPERDAFSAQIDKHLENLQQEFDQHRDGQNEAKPVGSNLPPVVQNLCWAKSAQKKLEQTKDAINVLGSSALLGGSSETEDGLGTLRGCLGVVNDLNSEVEQFSNEQFKNWQDSVSRNLHDLHTWKTGELMSFDKVTGKVETHFGDGLVTLMKEVRHLKCLGFRIKKEVLAEEETARKLFRYGLVLKQVANFYSDIGTQMIPCQKPMMLRDAEEFEKVLMNPRDGMGREITWKNVLALGGYAKRLEEVSHKLTEKNRTLRKWHGIVGEKVLDLMNTDVVRHKFKWISIIKEIRGIFSRLVSDGFTADSQRAWRQHWDFQIYKALDAQYSRGLEYVNEGLPEVEIKIVFKQRRLQFEPPLEELRTKHYKEYLNVFLKLPLTLTGVSDLSESPGFFRHIINENSEGIAQVYGDVEALFGRLSDELKKYQDWVALGTVDLDDFAEQNLDEVSDWVLNFKVLKAAAKDAEKLPNEVKVDCYKISIAALKASTDELMKKLQEVLVSSLRKKAVQEAEDVVEFMRSGNEMLKTEANNIEEIGLARQKAQVLVKDLSRMMEQRKRVEEKNKLLRQMAGGGNAAQFAVVDLKEIVNEWEGFTTQLQQHGQVLEERKEQLQHHIVKQIDEFSGRIVGLSSRWHELKPKGAPQGDPAIILTQIEGFALSLEQFREEAAGIERDCQHFSMDPPDFSALDEVSSDLDATKEKWNRYGEFQTEKDELACQDWLSIRDRLWKVEDFLSKWTKAMEGSGTDPVALIVMREIDTYRRCMPNLTYVKGNGWDRRHWSQLFGLLNLQTKGPGAVSVENLTLAVWLGKADVLIQQAEALKALDAQAQGEALLRKALDELNAWGYERKFVLVDYTCEGTGRRSVCLIKDWSNLLTEVGDNQSLAASLRQSPYFNLMKDEIQVWERRLGTLSECLGNLKNIQRKWVYLEPIFSKGALPQHQPRFSNVDEQFRQLMVQVKGDPYVARFAEIPRISENLPQVLTQLEICQKALADFLEEKRTAFPRFYFIGDDDLLEILGQSKNPLVIQAHLKKIFGGIHKVLFTDDQTEITSMLSVEGERGDFFSPVKISATIEEWINCLCTAMQTTLSQQLSENLKAQVFKLQCSQILCLGDAIRFNKKAETAIKAGALQDFKEQLQAQLMEYTGSDWTGYRVMQLKIQALVLDVIHYLDVVERLIEHRVSAVEDWHWSKQLKYHNLGQNKAVSVCMGEAEFDYSWEYQGNAPKLVYTPLTDKCYLTLTQGMALGYGGNPYGPAGTGKTESVKALGQAFGRQVLVFNCDEEFDFKSMGRIFVGLVRCGAWGCFDEFNRLEEEVLSAVSQQIQVIQGALKDGQHEMVFLNKNISVNKNAGIFVTMNPAGKGYGGRSKLPDNLKQLFRSVAMTVPDNELIAEVLLLSEGFKLARRFGQKLVSLFSLARQLLSPQQHYDWGLRALKTTLSTAGKLLRDAREQKENKEQIEETDEGNFIMRSVRATKLPTLTFDDTKRFLDLLVDIFPDQQVSDITDENLQQAIQEVMSDWKLELMPEQVDKILQLHLACQQRIGVIIVGPSGSGKSTLWMILESAYKKLNKPLARHVMNPKAISRQLLLGKMDLDTREWSDGVLTAAARQVVKEPLEKRSWIICDGDVDPEWIESLNSVLDDNRLLTLPSGERIQFASNVNFIFECHTLEFASPATVSRCGVIFMSDDHLGVERLVQHWMKNTIQPSHPGELQSWMASYFYKALNWSLDNAHAVETTKVGVINSALSHLASVQTKEDFVCGLARGFGANMTMVVRQEFLNQLMRWTGVTKLIEILCSYQPNRSAGMKSLMETKRPVQDIVMTTDVKRNLAKIMPWLDNDSPLLLVGPEGCGKAKLLEYAFGQLDSVAVSVVHCCAQTTATNVLQKLAQMCGKPVSTNQGKVIRPKSSDRMILYLKDINLPRADKYNSVQLIAFLQQLITYNGFYDENLEFLRLQNIQIVATMTPASNLGRRPISTRLTSIMRIAYITYPAREDLQVIYRTMLSETLAELSKEDSTWSQGHRAADGIASAMIDVFEGVTKAFTTSECRHYVFTPRMITRWVEGLKRYGLHGSAGVLDAVHHEACRIFRDRLASSEARSEFDAILNQALRSLGFNGDLGTSYWTTLGAPAEERLSDSNIPVQLTQWQADDFSELISEKLKAYEREQKPLNLVLLPEVLDRIARFDCVLSRPGGSMVLTGSSGIGRRVCVALVAFMHHMKVFSPQISRGYSVKNFKEDLKEVILTTGIEGQVMCLLLEDHQIIDNVFLELINSLLSAGEVPGLFGNEELQKMLAPLQETLAEEGLGYSNVFSLFASRVRRNLKIVLSMDPQNEQYWMRCESNPALLNQCFIQWLDTWSFDGMKNLPLALLQGVEGIKEPEVLVHFMMRMHEAMKSRGAAPRQYVSFVDLSKRLFMEKRKSLQEQQNFLMGGLEKLAEASATVDVLSQEASSQRVLLGQKQEEAEDALQRITASMAQAADRRREVEDLQKKLSIEEIELNERRGGVEHELEGVQPMIDEARRAVGQIKSDNLNEIRSLKMPPEAIRDVLEGVLLLMDQKDTSWKNMKKFLSSKSVKDQIINYDARRITPDIRSKVGKFLEEKGRSFEHATIYRVSVAAAPLAAWVKANIAFSRVLQKVAPLEMELEKLKDSLEASRDRLVQCEEELEQLDDQVKSLKLDFQKKTSEAESLKVNLAKAERTLDQAEMLLGKLSGEKDRWEGQVETLSQELDLLPLNALMSAGFITYLPSEPEDIREVMLQEWADLLKVPEYSFRRFMSSESQMLTWKAEGLPGDDLSIENAIAILNTNTSPLVIDPSTQAIKWLSHHLHSESMTVETVTMQDPRFHTTLELAVRFGKTLLVHDVDSIEPLLYPLLRKDLSKQGPRLVVRIGDKFIDYNESFKLFLVTRNPTPKLPPDARPLVAVTNFTVTRNGLEGQLLSLTIQNEEPELELQRSTLLKQEEELKVQLADIEKHLLHTLANSRGNILENEELLQSLNETKAKSSTISAGLAESKELHCNLDKQREVYCPVAQRGSLIFFAIKDLHVINHAYFFSLPVFLSIFNKALATSEESVDITSRIAVLNQTLVELLFMYVSRSLFNSDRLVFGMHLVRSIRPELFTQESWDFFMGNIVFSESNSQGGHQQQHRPSWIPEKAIGQYNTLKRFPAIVSECDFDDVSLWAPWVNSGSANVRLPGRAGSTLNSFQQLMVVKAFRPDRLKVGMAAFICSTLNIKNVSPPPFSLPVIQQELTAQEPILFLTTPGADPSEELAEFANQTIGRGHYHEVAMGQGQSDLAMQLLYKCAETGDWLCLKNLHLVVSWLPTLEKEVHSVNKHKDFRLFFTSEPHPKFPSGLSESCLKITFEAPPGVKRNLQRSYEGWTQEFIGSDVPVRAQLLFLLAWFHAILQERRNYIPQGWHKFYEFSFADLRSGADVIMLGTKNGKTPQWSYLHGLLENAIYGGRVDNISDVKILRTYLHDFFSTETLGLSGKSKAILGSKIMVPTNCSRHTYLQLIQGLSDIDNPALFGLPANIERAAQENQSQAVITQLNQMTISQASNAAFNRAKWQKLLSPIIRLWESLLASHPHLNPSRQASNINRINRGKSTNSNPLDLFLMLEWECGKTITSSIHSTLASISRVLKGSESLSPNVQEEGLSLIQHQVPTPWEKIWDGPEDPLCYCQAVISRYYAIEKWVAKSSASSGDAGWMESGSGKQWTLNLARWFHPDTFLNALRQYTARHVQVPIDGLKMVTCWGDSARQLRAEAPIWVQVEGLQIQGAIFDGTKLETVSLESPSSCPIPSGAFAWVQESYSPPCQTTAVPLYSEETRSKLLTEVQMPVSNNAEASQWILAGLAIFLQD
ncbi:hypothetical protein BSKO_02968 [Bryopsis sp. KO-2023]|nr:hypothetical protein BSKO_02968 [Bryopsis sp. KO-2023]